jgi:2'-5' RNA ligase
VAAVVTAVVCAGFDSATDSAIAAVQTQVLDLDPRLRAPGNRPHLTLSAARVSEGAELDAVVDVVAQVAGRHEPVPLTLGHLGAFRRAGVLWLGPAPSARLDAVQADAARSLLDAGWPPAFGDQNDPQRWVPHCTLARNARRVPTVAFSPVRALVDRLVIILLRRGEFTSIRLPDASRPS